MNHFKLAILFITLFLVATAEKHGMPKISTPMTQLLLHDQLHTAIRPAQSTSNNFKGRVEGKFIADTGSGNYKGTFNGKTSGKKLNTYFKYKVYGKSMLPGLNFNYDASVYGNVHVYGKNVKIGGKFDSAVSGSMYGTLVNGRVKGKMKLGLNDGNVEITELGRFRFMVGGKKMMGVYKAYFDTNNMLSVSMRGVYGGKRFFVRYSLSASVVKLMFGGKDPLMIKRNYGTVYIHSGGKTVVKKFDMKGWEFPAMT